MFIHIHGTEYGCRKIIVPGGKKHKVEEKNQNVHQFTAPFLLQSNYRFPIFQQPSSSEFDYVATKEILSPLKPL